MSDRHYQRVLDAYQAVRRLPTLVAGVLADGDLAWTGSAGRPVDPDTQFRIGSITKTFTAVLVLQARNAGLLGLDDPIGTWVPGTAYGEVTVRQLLAHTGGLQSEPAGSWWERSEGVGPDTLLARPQTPVATPGSWYHYSNLGYALLGEAVARIHHESWRDLVARRVCTPLGLQHTSYLPLDPAAHGWSVHHLRGTLTAEPATDTRAMAPAGQLWSTVPDLARYLRFLRAGHPDVLDAATLREMSRPDPIGGVAGLCLWSRPSPAGVLVGHPGSMPGYQAVAFVSQENGAGVVALTDATTGFDGAELVDRLLGDVTPPAAEAWLPTAALPSWGEELLGTWYWGNSAFEARWHNERLELHDLARGRLAEQFDRTGDRIVGVAGYHRGETLHVIRDETGGVHHLECATFVYTRTPYDPTAPIPGGAPS